VTASGDCDDNDPKVHPNQTTYFLVARDGGSFDYNCNGSIEMDPTVDCSDSLACGSCTLSACAGNAGFDGGIPACGGSGSFCFCAYDDLDAGTCSALVGTAPACTGNCPGGHSEYQAQCTPMAMGCH
jgi:hypothetical protein